MDFQITDEQKMIQAMARDVGQKEVAPFAEELDGRGEFPARQIQKLAELGLMGMMVPTEWDGAGLDTVTYALALEEICAADASTGITMSVNNSLYCAPINKYATDEQKKKYLSPFARGLGHTPYRSRGQVLTRPIKVRRPFSRAINIF